MLSFVKSLSLLFFFMGCCVGAEITVPESEQIKRPRLLPNPPVTPSSFRIDIASASEPLIPCVISPGFNGTTPVWLLKSPSEATTPYGKFSREKADLLKKVKETSSEERYRHVIAFDFDGVLTSNSHPIPVDQIKFSDEGCDFYQQLTSSGATVLVTSSRFNQQEIVDALKTRGIQLPNPQIKTIGELEFTYAGNVVSACSKGNKAFELRAEKFEAAIFGYKRHFEKQKTNAEEVCPALLSVTLIDDNKENVSNFTRHDAGALFGIPHPKADGMFFPTAALNNE